VDPRAGLDDVEKKKFLTLPGFELRPLSRPGISDREFKIPRCGRWVTTGDMTFIPITEINPYP
jgi:hypothetical protein